MVERRQRWIIEQPRKAIINALRAQGRSDLYYSPPFWDTVVMVVVAMIALLMGSFLAVVIIDYMRWVW